MTCMKSTEFYTREKREKREIYSNIQEEKKTDAVVTTVFSPQMPRAHYKTIQPLKGWQLHC